MTHLGRAHTGHRLAAPPTHGLLYVLQVQSRRSGISSHTTNHGMACVMQRHL